MRNPRLHGYLSFAGSLLETAAKSLHLSCGSELTRQGISLAPYRVTNIVTEADMIHGCGSVSLHVAMQMGPSLRPKHRTFDVWPLRIPPRFRAPAFPADRLAHRFGIDERLADCRCHLGGDEHRRIRQIFQQIVELAKAAIHLRTVIVTAAVHRGFSSSLSALPLTFRHWAGVSPYT